MKTKKLIIGIFSLLFSSNNTIAQVDLGTASSFALFTVAGAFDNVGESHFIGDIGTDVGAITGFPPGTLTGQIHQANPTTAQAAIDVENAYNYLTSIPCDSVIGNSLGGGQVLTPNVYCVLTAASLTGELILDGENIPNAIFIIKITGVLDLIGLSKISLINSVIVTNVYWQIDGAVNIGDSAIFRGSFIANGAISVAAGAKLNGNGLSRVGAITTFGITSTIPDDTDLPIELISFEGMNMHTHNLIFWTTASETNNSYFTLERTTDGINFIELTRINGAGTSTSTNSYSYADLTYERELNYYRLTQTDFDGKSEIFGLILINNLQTASSIVKVINMLGQEIDRDYIGLRMIYFDNGEVVKVSGVYVYNE